MKRKEKKKKCASIYCNEAFTRVSDELERITVIHLNSITSLGHLPGDNIPMNIINIYMCLYMYIVDI